MGLPARREKPHIATNFRQYQLRMQRHLVEDKAVAAALADFAAFDAGRLEVDAGEAADFSAMDEASAAKVRPSNRD